MKCLYSDCPYYEAQDDGDGFDPYCRIADEFLEPPSRADEQECVAGFALEKDYANIGAVCYDCAKSAGFTPKDKAVGVWVDECGICHKKKPCTNLIHDWNPPKKGGAA